MTNEVKTNPNQPPNQPEEEPLRSIHTNSFSTILNQLGISLIVSTYQAGKLIVVRSDQGVVNTHFRNFNKPMGLATTREKLALGTASEIWEMYNLPSVASKIEPLGKHDACYLPRQIRITGDIDIHEMAWVFDELWFINTRFSCLCTLDKTSSFVPRWRPPFITTYEASDLCHLNGLATRDNRPKYVTALGETNTPQGWRQNKANGGILIDIETNEILLRGLSMPHSPRWYDHKLWFLESGKGSLSFVDLDTKEIKIVAELPGFTRGIDFYGNLAFVGLSQVRETAVFSGIPLTQKISERICGVWVVDIQKGEIIAFLQFQQAVQEIFAISVLPNIRFPDVFNLNTPLIATSYTIPNEFLAEAVVRQTDEKPANLYYQQGNKLYYERKFNESIECYRKCLELMPDYLPARYNLGIVLGDTEQFDEAIAELLEVVKAEARHAEAYNSLAYISNQKGLLDKALEYYYQAINIEPNYAVAHYNLGMTLLKLGDFKQGWTEYEWRLKTPQFKHLNLSIPIWQGESLEDKRLLVCAEQGAGDTIQFIRYVPMLAKLGAKISIACPDNLVRILETVEGITEVSKSLDNLSARFDYYIPALNIAKVMETDISNIPANIPYLKAPRKKALITNENNLKKVGIVWAGSPSYHKNHQRSCKLTELLPILEVPNIQFYSLQKGDAAAELKELPSHIAIEDLDPKLNDYADTAAFIKQLDLVISVDTSVAHLTGALGKNVWVLLCANSDWRWLTERNDSPWYPTVTLFRQSEQGNWSSVVEPVIAALKKN